MVWAGVIVTYFVIAVATLWLHARYFIHVAVGFCEVKYSRLHIGRAKYSLMNTGSHFIFPFIQKRMMVDGAPSAVFPVERNAGRADSTDKVFGRTADGGVDVLVQAEFTYYVEDAAVFVRDEFTPFMLPGLVAYTRAREILEKAVAMTRSTGDDEDLPHAIASVLEKACDKYNEDSALKVSIDSLQRCAVLNDVQPVRRKRADRRRE